jgi:hypothetical protein
MPIIICLAWDVLRRHFVEQANRLDWVNPVMGSISVSWPYSDDMVFAKDEDTGLMAMSQLFRKWIWKQEHWSLHRDAALAVPDINGRAYLR